MRSLGRWTWPPSRATGITPEGSPSSTSRSFPTALERLTSSRSSSNGQRHRTPAPRPRRPSAIPSPRLLRTLALLASAATWLGAVPCARADPGDRLMVDVSRDAAALIEPRATERLIELETADVDVPAPPGATFRPPL